MVARKLPLGERIQLARKRRGLKQIELARDTGIRNSRLSLIEHGWEKPKADELQKLNAALDTAFALEG